MKTKTLQIREFIDAARPVLRQAFRRKTPKIAASFAVLGKPISARAVRKMTETEPLCRNPLEQALLLLGAVFLVSPASFDLLWQFLAAFRDSLAGRLRAYRTRDEAFAEFRWEVARAERAWYRGETEEVRERLLIQVDQALRAFWWSLQVTV